MTGCAGKDGKMGPAGLNGVNGSNGSNAFPFTYVGNNVNSCGTCHSDIKDAWVTAKHSWAYDSLPAADQNIQYCLQCHTTGFDTHLANFGDTVSTVNRGPDRFGFDDAYINRDSVRIAALKNVQCEACHGAYYDGYDNNPHQEHVTVDDQVHSDGTSASLCVKCHGEIQLAEWKTSRHGSMFDSAYTRESFRAEWANASQTAWNTIGSLSNCWECHVAEGFIHANDPTDPLFASPPAVGDGASMIGCATCHDQHGNSNKYQLRNLTDEKTVYFANSTVSRPPQKTMTGYGTSQACVQCHHDRRDTTSVKGQIASGNTRFGSHDSPQMDEFIGAGCYEIADSSLVGLTGILPYDNNRNHSHNSTAVADSAGRVGCVMCHMPIVGVSPKHTEHKFAADIVTCQRCHSGAASFETITMGNGGSIPELDALAAQLRNLLNPQGADAYTISDDSLGSPRALAGHTTPQSTVKTRKAAWAWNFWRHDLSHGVHNPKYTKAILTNAIAYLNSTNP